VPSSDRRYQPADHEQQTKNYTLGRAMWSHESKDHIALGGFMNVLQRPTHGRGIC
jgi:hypothetical protein